MTFRFVAHVFYNYYFAIEFATENFFNLPNSNVHMKWLKFNEQNTIKLLFVDKYFIPDCLWLRRLFDITTCAAQLAFYNVV